MIPPRDPAAARAALAGVQPDALRAAAAHLPPPLAASLRQLALALEQPGDDEALRRALDTLPQDPDFFRRALPGLPAAFSGATEDLAEVLGRLGPVLGATGPLGASLADQAEDILRDPPADLDPAVVEALEQAVRLGRTGLGGADLAAIPLQLQALSAELTALLQDPAAATASGEMQARLDELERLAQLLESAAPTAERTVDALRRAQQALSERPAPLPRPPATPVGGEGAFRQALAQGDLEAARRIGQQLQRAALAREDHAAVARISGRIAALAAQRQEVRAEVLARLEQALALHRLPDQQPAAREILQQALGRAEAAGEHHLLAQARLVQGQLLEQADDRPAALGVLRALLRDAEGKPEQLGLAGRAALSLGRIAARDGRARAAREHLGMALTLGRQQSDWMLYAPALEALLDLALQADDQQGVQALLADARGQALRMAGPPALEALEALVQARLPR